MVKTKAQEVSPQNEAELPYTEGGRTLEEAVQVMESPSLETFKNDLGMFLCNLL